MSTSLCSFQLPVHEHEPDTPWKQKLLDTARKGRCIRDRQTYLCAECVYMCVYIVNEWASSYVFIDVMFNVLIVSLLPARWLQMWISFKLTLGLALNITHGPLYKWHSKYDELKEAERVQMSTYHIWREMISTTQDSGYRPSPTGQHLSSAARQTVTPHVSYHQEELWRL